MAAENDVRDQLIRRIDDLLGGSLGLNVLGIPPPRVSESERVRQPETPLLAGAAAAMSYAALFIGLPLLLWGWPARGSAMRPLFLLQLYGAFWCGTSTTLTSATSPSIQRIIETELVPFLSRDSARRLINKLDHASYRRNVQICAAWTIGILAAAAAGLLVGGDLRPGLAGPSLAQLVWWCAGWALLYATAARVVLTSRVCMLFGGVLSDEPKRLSPVNPGQSPLVASLLALTKRMMLFWSAMAMSIALVLPFGLAAWAYPWRADPSGALHSVAAVWNLRPAGFGFVLVHFVVTTILSIGGGTLILLKSEAAARAATRRATNGMLRRLDAEATAIAADKLDEDAVKRLVELKTLHSDIAARGSYRGLAFAAAGVILPFLPLITFLVGFLGR
jgi:hypothetical protein